MIIKIAASVGAGPTKLSAFDKALFSAGVANYNLLCLSSVIPPSSQIRVYEGAADVVDGEWGDKLYVVKAEYRQDVVGKEAWAGIGWVQDSETDKGLFVEHEGETRESVESDIRNSLTTLMKTRGIDFGEINMKVSGVVCESEPVCALVLAVYESDGWKG
jgi:arginine decarboxylase